MPVSRLPWSSRTLSAPASTVNSVGSARREVTTSTSTPVQAPIAASSSSTGVKSAQSPVPVVSWPPRTLLTVNRPALARVSRTLRWFVSSAMPPPCQTHRRRGPPPRPGSVLGHLVDAVDHAGDVAQQLQQEGPQHLPAEPVVDQHGDEREKE